MRTLIAGGGTGGHLTPALAVAQALRGAVRGGEVVVVGREGGVAERLVTEAGVRLETLAISGVDVSDPRSVARALVRMPAATIAARSLLRRVRPDVVVGAGGYVCVPVVLAAMANGVPVVLMEQNAFPGRAIRMLARRAYAVAASFAQTANDLPGARVVTTGNPIRSEVIRRVGEAPRGSCRRILVTGGSQGARRLNQAMGGGVERLLKVNPDVLVTHQCGTLDIDLVRSAAASLPADLAERYHVAPFFDDLADRMADSDLVVMRAGGSSLAECSALGRAMILVPYPYAGGHQAHNVTAYVRSGAAVVIEDAVCTPERLLLEITALLRDTERWREMSRASAAAGRPDATDRVVDLIVEASQSRKRPRAA